MPAADRRGGGRPAWAPVTALFLAVLLAGWGLGGIVSAASPSFDAAAVRHLAGERTGPVTAVMQALSFIGSAYVIEPVGLALVGWLLWRGRRRLAVGFLAVVAGGLAIAPIDKALVGRLRPSVHHLESVSSTSFPSGHATQSAAFFLSLMLLLHALRAHRGAGGEPAAARVALALLPLGVAVSRVYLGVHYPTDVVAGLLLGSAWALLSGRVVGVLEPRGAGRGRRR